MGYYILATLEFMAIWILLSLPAGWFIGKWITHGDGRE